LVSFLFRIVDVDKLRKTFDTFDRLRYRTFDTFDRLRYRTFDTFDSLPSTGSG
jgi:hypothetical protein